MQYQFDPLHLIRGLQVLFAIINTAIYGAVVSYYNRLPSPLNAPPSQFAYLIFVSAFTLLLALPYLILNLNIQSFPRLGHKYAIFTVEALTCLLWFAAWVASAAYLNSLTVCRGGTCTTAKVGTAFAAFEWALFGATAWFAGQYCFGKSYGVERRSKGSNGLGGNVGINGLNISKPVPVSPTTSARDV